MFCSLLWPRHPGHSGGEIRDFHLVRHLASLSDVEFFALHHLPGAGRRTSCPRRCARCTIHGRSALARPDLVHPERLPAKVLDRLVRRMRRARLPVIGRRYHFDVEVQLVNARTWSLGALAEAIAGGPPDFLFVSPQVNPVGLMLSGPAGRPASSWPPTTSSTCGCERLADAARGVSGLALRLEAGRAGFEADNLATFRRRDRGERAGSPSSTSTVTLPAGAGPRRRERRRPRLLLVRGASARGAARSACTSATCAIRRTRRRRCGCCGASCRSGRAIPARTPGVVPGAGPPPELLSRRPGTTAARHRPRRRRAALPGARPGSAASRCWPARVPSTRCWRRWRRGCPLVCSPLAVEGLDRGPRRAPPRGRAGRGHRRRDLERVIGRRGARGDARGARAGAGRASLRVGGEPSAHRRLAAGAGTPAAASRALIGMAACAPGDSIPPLQPGKTVILCLDTLGDLTLRQPLFSGLLDAGFQVTVVVRRGYETIVPILDRRLEVLVTEVNPYSTPGPETLGCSRGSGAPDRRTTARDPRFGPVRPDLRRRLAPPPLPRKRKGGPAQSGPRGIADSSGGQGFGSRSAASTTRRSSTLFPAVRTTTNRRRTTPCSAL